MDLLLARYKDPIEWIDKAASKNISWDEIKYARKNDKEGLETFLSHKVDDDLWDEITADEWIQLVDEYQRINADSITVSIPYKIVDERDALNEPTTPQSAWKLYKKMLSEQKHFSYAAINNIQKSSLITLNHLSDENGNKAPIKGLVVGNVQSGKTANMAGLISMAADYGWNLFIILTGSIENLRLQTQKRFQDDLQNGNITWNHINRPGQDVTCRLDRLDFGKKSRVRHIVCCLKESRRLTKLYRWLNSDINVKQQLKILIIDDECDQASLNTKEEERTAINKLIVDIVNNNSRGRSKYGDIPYAAMNYIGYTATPYGNFLNENSAESLFPKDFITLLTTPDTYLGPQQIFGDPYSSTWDGMPIINNISSPYDYEDSEEDEYDEIITDTAMLEDLIENGTGELPDSLKRAIAWFCDCVAIQRYKKSRLPVSMLLHNSHKTGNHKEIATGVYRWYSKISEKDFLDICEDVYNEQTSLLSKEIFKSVCPDYGRNSNLDLDRDIEDYPLFEDIKNELMILYRNMEHIMINSEGDIHFHNGIHLCVDNSATSIITDSTSDAEDDENAHVRLLYPNNQNEYRGYAPAFLIVGGNTLSRGLTLEGLVCTYFSRNVSFADSLMQMGRWFGYRRGYELLPRLWLTKKTLERFIFLSELDADLRLNLFKYHTNLTPLECAPMIMNTPGVRFLQITSAGKMKGAVPAEMNFAGVNIQTTKFRNDQSLVRNFQLTERFLTGLDKVTEECVVTESHKVWYKVPFNTIWKDYLSKAEFNYSQGVDIDLFNDWITDITNKEQLEDWNVILSGNEVEFSNEENTWLGIGKVVRSRKINGVYGPDSEDIQLGVMANPNDWCADMPEEFEISDEDLKILNTPGKGKTKDGEKDQAKSRVRELNGFGKIPMLIIYCIDKNSTTKRKGRAPLNVNHDMIGIAIRVPGDRKNKNLCSRLTIMQNKDNTDDEN